MSATIIDGNQVARDMRADIARHVATLTSRGIHPGLAVVLVGDNPASLSYVTAKTRACAEAGIASFDHRLPATTTELDLLQTLAALNADPRIHGILVQLPLPGHIREANVIAAIDPGKDVDGFHPVNVGKLLLGEPAFLPCTPHGIIHLLRRTGVKLSGAHAVVVGRSNIVGKPVAALLARRDTNATVTLCHTGTRDLGLHTRQADILVVAAGRPGTIKADQVKPGAVVIDVGVNRIPDATAKSGFRLVGDVDFASVSQVASHITPVPGGVGPMTITLLLQNTVDAAAARVIG